MFLCVIILNIRMKCIHFKIKWNSVPEISIENCLDIIQEFPKAKYQYPEIFEYFKEQTNYLKNYISNELPKGVVHGDCFADNTIFNGDKLKAIIEHIGNQIHGHYIATKRY